MDKVKRAPNAWVQAVKQFNAKNGGRYTIPRKPKDGEEPSKEYLEVRALMMNIPGSAPAAAPAEKRPKGRPRKPVIVEDPEIPTDTAVSMGPKRKVRRATSPRTVEPSATTPKIAIAEMDDSAPVEAEAPKRGRGRPRKVLQTS